MMNELAAPTRTPLAQHMLIVLPLLLFLPQGLTGFGVLVYLVLLLAGGQWAETLARVRAHPMLPPVLVMFAVSVAAGLLLERPPREFWPGFVHYQVYAFLLLFIAVGGGDWQQQAVRVFYASATMAATLLYLSSLHLLPDWHFFSSYALYSGNKSILIGLLLAIAAGWMLNDLVAGDERSPARILQFFYVAVATVALGKTRTGLLVFILCAVVVLVGALRLSWRRAGMALLVTLAALLALQLVPNLSKRITGTIADTRNFAEGGKISGDGVRLEIYRITLGMVADKPITGQGIGTWLPRYSELTRGTTNLDLMHNTPHNDYLLHLAEMGAIGLAALLGIWAVQVAQVRRLAGAMRARLLMLCIAMATAAMFNAVMRDFVFALPFMVLLAIPLAGLRKGKAPA